MTDEPLEERIVDVLRDAPDESASTATIVGLLEHNEEVSPPPKDVEEAVHQLLDEDRVVVDVEEEGPRYRLVDEGY